MENKKLSLTATGLLNYLLFIKEKEEEVNYRKIRESFTDEERSIKSAIDELTEKGYVNIYRSGSKDGKYSNFIYDVYKSPMDNPNNYKGN